MLAWLIKNLKRLAILVGAVLVTFLAVRVCDAERGPPLEPWHTFVPDELSVAEMDRTDWAGYVAAEDRIFAAVRDEVSRTLPPEDRLPINCYFDGSPVYPPRLPRDWNRSQAIAPQGPVRGAAVFLHGLTDSPYSLRHVARRYAERGYVGLAVRLPGHGTVPGGLTGVTYADWLAATRLAVREARRRAGPDAPIDIVGYSNGGALALMYAIAAMDDPSLPKPARIVLVSPMVGVTAFARFAGLAGLPALLPAFAKAAWLSRLPEFNPFKYNSFPVNAARQSYLLTQTLQAGIQGHLRNGLIEGFPPVLTFQSVLDHTVSTSAVVSALHVHLAAGRSELVLFDVNRNAKVDELLRASAQTALDRLLPPPPWPFPLGVVTNRDPEGEATEARVTEAGASLTTARPLDLAYPRDVYSLSHIALPFPVDDGLYGTEPSDDPAVDFGVRLGTVAARGERDALVVGLDVLMRMSSNPFMPYLLDKVGEGLPPAGGAPAAPGG